MDLAQRARLGGGFDCLLDRRVRTDFDDDDEMDLIGLQPFKVLRCVEKTAVGFSPELQGYATEVVQSFHLGVHLASGPPGLSCLGLRGGSPLTKIEAVDQGILVLTTTFLHDFSRVVYLVYDADDGSLHMAPAPEDPSWLFTGLTVRLLIVRPIYGDYTLALLGKLDGEGDAVFVWRPRSSSLPPWYKIKAVGDSSLIGESSSLRADCTFSASGMSCWADLLRGITFCYSLDLLGTGLLNKEYIKFSFFPLPEELVEKSKDHRRSNTRVAQPEAYRAMGATLQSSSRNKPPFYDVRFVSIDGFLEPIDLKHRAVTVWCLCQKELEWKLEYKISLKALWEFNGFGDLPRNLTPMYPLLSPNDKEVVYFALGECREKQSNWLFIPTCARYLLAVDLRHKTILASVCLSDYFGRPTIPDIISSDFQRRIHTVSLDLHIMLMETMKLMSLTLLDPAEYDEEEAKKLMKEEEWIWHVCLKEEDRPLPLPLPARYYTQPSLVRLIGNRDTTLKLSD